MISCTVVLASTNPSAVFDNGVCGIVPPNPSKDLTETEASQVSEERDEEHWDVHHWTQKSNGDLFFDQVAELECLQPVMNEECQTFSDLHLGHSTPPPSLFDDSLPDSLPDSPWSSSVNSEDKEYSDDSDKIRDECGTNSSSKRKKINESPFEGCQKIKDKRVRNNQASKKFRKLRKGRHKALFENLQALENENYQLNTQLEQMIQEINHLKTVLPEHGIPCMPMLE